MASIISSGRGCPSSEEQRAHLETILASPKFRSANLSARLLAYLLDWSLEHPGEHLKETELALIVFRRQADSFDPQCDSVVRVQMARLRTRLAEYYAEEGQSEPIRLEIPKGGYQLVAGYTDAREHVEEQAEPPQAQGRPWRWMAAALALGLVAGGTLVWVWMRPRAAGPQTARFWSSVISLSRPTLVVYSNPRLMGTLARDGLHYYQEGADGKPPLTENFSYAGSGDVMAVHRLTELMQRLSHPMRVQAGSHLSWDDARASNLVFVGRPEQNPALRRLPRLSEFRFKFWEGIVNVHPAPGEKANYASSGRPYTYDHAIVARVHGLSPGSTALILAGTTTYGSQAAADFVCDETSLDRLLAKLGILSSGPIPHFEALLEVRINNETPVWSKLVAARKVKGAQESWEEPPPEER